MNKILFRGENFSQWTSLNDTIMGGKSSANCYVNKNGLTLSGTIVEKGGGFVSCRSQIYRPTLDLSDFSSFKIILEGKGRTLKFAVACDDRLFGITELIPGGIRWISSVPTNKRGSTTFLIPFESLRPTIRASKVTAPIKFNKSKVNRFQILHSKFGDPGELNEKFIPGEIKFLIKEISVQ